MDKKFDFKLGRNMYEAWILTDPVKYEHKKWENVENDWRIKHYETAIFFLNNSSQEFGGEQLFNALAKACPNTFRNCKWFDRLPKTKEIYEKAALFFLEKLNRNHAPPRPAPQF